MDHRKTDIGSRIRQAREHRGLTLADISRRTRLTAGILQAIEANDLDRLPGGLYKTAYVRTVATEVGLDAEALVSECKARLESEAAAAQDAQPPPPAAAERYLSALRWIAALAIAAAGLWWSASLNAPEPEIEAGPPALAAETFHLISVPASVTSKPATPQ